MTIKNIMLFNRIISREKKGFLKKIKLAISLKILLKDDIDKNLTISINFDIIVGACY